MWPAFRRARAVAPDRLGMVEAASAAPVRVRGGVVAAVATPTLTVVETRSHVSSGVSQPRKSAQIKLAIAIARPASQFGKNTRNSSLTYRTTVARIPALFEMRREIEVVGRQQPVVEKEEVVEGKG